MSEKIYKVKGDHLNALGEAAGIIVAFLESIKADDALLSFSAAQAILKLKPSEESAQKHKHVVCKCKEGGAVATTCACDTHTHRVTKKAAKILLTMHQLADELGVDYKKIKNFAYKNDLGIVRRGPRGNVTRELFPADVDAIREHFGNRS